MRTRDDLQNLCNQNTGPGHRVAIGAVSPLIAAIFIRQREIGRAEYKASKSVSFSGEFSTNPALRLTAFH